MTEEQLKEFTHYPNQYDKELYLDEIDKFMKDQRLKELTCNGTQTIVPDTITLECPRCGHTYTGLKTYIYKMCGNCLERAMQTGEIKTIQSSMSKL